MAGLSRGGMCYFLCLFLLFYLPLSNALALAPRAPLKVMIVGDSISQGHQGDYTWRYRLWEWGNGIAVDFVGPYTGTMPPADPAPPPRPLMQGASEAPSEVKAYGGYSADISSDFKGAHFSVWGRQVAQDKELISSMVSTYQPDYLLVELGFNDLGWFVSGPDGTLNSMANFVSNARSAKADIKFAIANVPYRTQIEGRDDLPIITDKYNQMLADAIPKWSTAVSPIYLVKFRESYSCELAGCPAGYDGLHPNALGEFQIAHAFSTALHDNYGLGSSALSVPANIPARPVAMPQNFVAKATALGITVTWDAVYNALGYDTRSRIKGFGAEWSELTVQSNRIDTTWTVDGLEHEYQVRSSYGLTLKSDWTTTASAVAHPWTAPGPKNIVTRASATGIDISWEPPDGDWGDVLYEVITWDKDTKGSFITSYGVKGTLTRASGLNPSHRYAVAVATWTSVGGGLPSAANAVVVGAGAPLAPTDLRVVTIDPTTVKLTWTVSDSAAGHHFFSRNIHNDTSEFFHDSQTTDVGCYGVAFLFPGTWNYEFCITAFNGNSESGMSNCMVPDQANSGESSVCPAYVPRDNDPWDLPNFPILTPVGPDPSLPPPEGDTYKNCDLIDKNGNLGQQAVDRGIADVIDYWYRDTSAYGMKKDKTDWDTKIWYPNPTTDTVKCSYPESTNCAQPQSCQFYPDSRLYWARTAIHNFFNDVKTMREIFILSWINSTTDVEQLAADFPIPQDDPKNAAIEILGILTTAFGFASTGAGFIKGPGGEAVSQGLGIIGDVTSAAKDHMEENEDKDIKVDLLQRLKWVLGNVTDGFDASLRDMFGTGDLSGWDSQLWYQKDKYVDIAAFFGNGQFLLPMDDDVRAKFKRDTDEYLRKGLLSASLVASKHYLLSGSYPSCGDSESPASCVVVDDIVYSLEKPGQGHDGYGVGFPDVYSEALSDDDLQPLTTAGVSIADLVRGSRNCQDKFNSYDPVPNNFVPAVSQAVEDTCLYTLPIFHVDVRDVGPPYKTDPRMPTPCKIRVENPDNTPSTPRAGSNYLPGRLASIFTSDFCESKCTLSPRVCNGNRFGPPENVTETA